MMTMINIDTKENYFSDFEVFAELYGKSFSSLRKGAIEEFLRIGFPTTKHEEWKYTNLAPLLKSTFKPANPALKCNIGKEEIERYKAAGNNANLIVFINGRYNAELSEISAKN